MDQDGGWFYTNSKLQAGALPPRLVCFIGRKMLQLGRICNHLRYLRGAIIENRLEGERWLKDAELVSGIAHEIKNPLTVIRGFLQLLAERVTDDARSSHYVAMIFNELSWLEELVEDCLCFGHIKEVSLAFAI